MGELAPHAPRPRPVVVDEHALAPQRRGPERPLAEVHLLPELALDEPVPRADDELILALGPEPDKDHVTLEELCGLARDQAQPLVERERDQDLLHHLPD